MKIVTGHTGENHVTSADFQAFNQGVFGDENYILNVGNKFDATMPDATHLLIQDGEGIMQGVHFRTERGTTDTVEIDAGATGVNRIDLVGALYEKDSQGVESVSWSVVKGTAVSGAPTDPTYETGDIIAGDSPVFFPMYKITLMGVTPTITSAIKKVDTISDVVNTIYPVGSIYMSVSNINPSYYFGGTWVEWGAGRVPVGVDTATLDFNSVEKTGGTSTVTLTTQQIPSHTHQYMYHYAGSKQIYNGDAVEIRKDTVDAFGDFMTTDTYASGGGQAHNNLQPYITCFMWKRTA